LLAAPNSQKVTIMLEELLALGHGGAEYDAWMIKIAEGEQFGGGLVAISPNAKSPLWSIAAARRRSASSNQARSSCTLPRSSAHSCRPKPALAPSACRGCSGGWAAGLISAGR
jgi:hypothetical protein